MTSEAYLMLIDGELSPASDGQIIPSSNPSNMELAGTIPNASAEDIDRAVSAARRAQKGWGLTDLRERRALLAEIVSVLRANVEELALLDTMCTGNIIGGMRNDVGVAAEGIEYLSALSLQVKGEASQANGSLHYIRREPYGVVLRLLPFNHPIASFAVSIAAPLLTGNTVVVKPSPHASLSALKLCSLVKDIVPPGVVNVITGDNQRVAQPLVEHGGIDRISLIGSVEAGKAVMRAAADRLLGVTLELGGKNPLVIFPDADVDQAVDVAVRGMNYAWQAHSCGATTRIHVHRKLEAEFLARLAQRIRSIRVGLPTDPASEMGPISFRDLYDRFLDYVSEAEEGGARLLAGGRPLTEGNLKNGLFVSPALFANVQPDMKIAREETFCPITSVFAWDDYNAMINVANDSDLGLTAVVMTNDLDAAHRAAKDLQVGYVEVNGPVSFALGSPFGGIKQSGIGREGDLSELYSYTQVKSVNVRLERFPR